MIPKSEYFQAFKKQQNIDESLEQCMEENPEMFGQVIMLYINCQINGHNVKAFVDSGAQMTILSSECARKCDLTDLVDVRFSGRFSEMSRRPGMLVFRWTRKDI